ncbi:molybdopterin-dependent oxidoreductase [Chloroflexota bacterium]
MKVSRRDFLKITSASAVAIAGQGLLSRLTYGDTSNYELEGVQWDKAPCRFCGTGCSVLVGVIGNDIVAVKGDPESPVNRGLLCIKGYQLLKIHSATDRLKKPLIRVSPKSVTIDAKFREASWDEALDLISNKFQSAIQDHGPESVAMFGSGQWTIWEGYAAAKLLKGGLSSNNLECNARHCMASAVAGFMTTFGIDEPMGCYDDFENADAFILWGANMAEMHPILWARISQRKLTAPNTRIINLTVISNRTSHMADREILFNPQSDLAIANGIANLLIQRETINNDFINSHAIFKSGKTNIGYGLEDNFSFQEEAQVVLFEDYKAHLATYTAEYVQEISGVAPDTLSDLADIYGNPDTKVMSLWTMGVNQHTRGTWMNNLIYNLHLLTGKISEPGNSPYSLTGQPSACGTAREVGTFAHRLPADMVVANASHREIAEQIWNIPADTISAKPGYHTVEMLRAIDRGEIKVFWSLCANPFQDSANLERYRKAVQKEDAFIIVSDVYPNRSSELADVILPTAMWVEKEGAYGNAERRTHFWKKMVEPPGDSKSDLWQIIEIAKRLDLGHLFQYDAQSYPLPQGQLISDASEAAGLYLEKAIWEEYRLFGKDRGHDLAPFELYHQTRGLRWPVVDGQETKWRFNENYDPYVEKGEGINFYGNEASDGKAVIWLRGYEPAAEAPNADYPFWLCTGRVMEHWHSGTMTRRVPALFKAYPHATAAINSDDAAELSLSTGDRIRITSRRGSVDALVEIDGRVTPQKGIIFVPWFDEDVMINNVTLDAFCPISKQTDFKKCAVKLEKM